MDARLVSVMLQRQAKELGFRIELRSGSLRLAPIGKRVDVDKERVARLAGLLCEVGNRSAMVQFLESESAKESADLSRLFPSKPKPVEKPAKPARESSASVRGGPRAGVRFSVARADSWRRAIPVRKDRRGVKDGRPMVELVDILALFSGDWSDSVAPEISGSARMLSKLLGNPSRFRRDEAEGEARQMIAAWEGIFEVLDEPTDSAGPGNDEKQADKAARQSLELPQAHGPRTGTMRTETRWHTWEGWRDVPAGTGWRLANERDWRGISRHDQIELIRIVRKREDFGSSTRIVVLEGEVCAIKGSSE